MIAARTLQLSPAFGLPLELVTQRNAILAMSGAGKSNLAVVLAEEMDRCGVPWIAIDPKGDWWGIRSSADGKGPGLRVPVLGGEHGDLPLSPTAGVRVGELIAGGKLAGVLDVSDFESDAALSRFMIDLGSTLLRRQRTPLHIFCEECSDYLPQAGAGGRLDPLAAKCVRTWKRVAKQGRFRGIGYTLISQRAAAVNKDALYQCETLIAMRVVGKRDKEAVRGWVEQFEGSAQLLKSLPTLEDGEAWIWSPQRLKLMQCVRVRRRRTYDSGRTPEIGETLIAPTLARVDLAALRAELELEPEQDDPANALRARIAELEGQLRRMASRVGPESREPGPPPAVKSPAPNSNRSSSSAPPAAAPAPHVVHSPTPASAKGWDPMEEDQYQKWKTRLIAELRQEAPALLKVLGTSPELEVTIERKVVEINTSTLRGRLAQLVAEDFFAEPQTGHKAFVELKRCGFATSKPNVYRELHGLAALGVVTVEGDGFRVAPGAKVRLKRAS